MIKGPDISVTDSYIATAMAVDNDERLIKVYLGYDPIISGCNPYHWDTSFGHPFESPTDLLLHVQHACRYGWNFDKVDLSTLTIIHKRSTVVTTIEEKIWEKENE